MSEIKRCHGPFTYGNFTIGNNSYIQQDTYVITTPDHYITVGDDCAIGHWVYLSTKMHKTENHLERFEGDIVIENFCWLGNNVVVYPGVTIHEGSVIGNAVCVTHDVPKNSLVRLYYQIEELKR